MTAFVVTEQASSEIKRIFHASQCLDPVARLYERADPEDLFDELKAAVRGGDMRIEEIESIGRRRLVEIGDQLKSTLEIGVCERSDFKSEDLFHTGDITFAMAASMVERLREFRLDFEGGTFVLLSADGVAHTLRSLPPRS